MSGLEIENQKHSNLRNDRVKSLCQPKNGELSTPCIISAIPCKYWVSCFFFIAFYGIIKSSKKGAENIWRVIQKIQKSLRTRTIINELNKTISAQTELIQSLQKTLETGRLEKESLRQQIEYLTKKLFGTSSENGKISMVS